MKDLNNIKVVISGGGTGGHIYPAIAIAKELKNRYPSCQILFVGAEGRMEMEKVPKAGFEIVGLPIAGIQRRFTLKNLLVPFLLLKSLRKASTVIKSYAPDVVIGVGGYASGPLLWSAKNRKVPILVQEQNSFAGLTNKILAKHANKICVAYEGMEAYFPKENIVITGNPVRQDILELKGKREQAHQFFKLDASKKTILVIGGSLGARTINESIDKGLDILDRDKYNLIWQTGKWYADQAKERTQKLIGVYASEFIYEMDMAYSASDVVVSRAGALSVSELCLAEKPTIFVPSPNVSEDHQTKNAQALVSKNAALMVKDVEAREILVNILNDLLKDEELQNTLAVNIKALAKPKATIEIVNQIEKIIKG